MWNQYATVFYQQWHEGLILNGNMFEVRQSEYLQIFECLLRLQTGK